MKVLVVNAGSSSLKYQLIDMSNEGLLAKGNCEKIGLNGSFIEHKFNDQKKVINQNFENHIEAISTVLNLLTSKDCGVINSLDEISAVGHRVLHGGEIYTKSVLITEEVLANLIKLEPLGPLHMPANIAGIVACQKVMKCPQIAVFDTAFHSSMQQEAFLYAIPYADYKEFGIRRYGFHGTSHKFVTSEASKHLNIPLDKLNIITVHLGNGSSIAAIKNGKSIDTTMGFTPLEGLMMGTRSGDIDASVVGFLAEKKNMTAGEVVTYLNKKSGILGVSELTSDMREINDAVAAGNARAKLIVPMLAHRIKKYIGAYAALLGRVDAIIFTGGIGENQDDLRELSLTAMEFFGIEIDVEKNKTLRRGTLEEISTNNSKVKVLRIPTNEELLIARDTLEIVKACK